MVELIQSMWLLALILSANTFLLGIGVGLWWSERTVKQSVTSAVEKAIGDLEGGDQNGARL